MGGDTHSTAVGHVLDVAHYRDPAPDRDLAQDQEAAHDREVANRAAILEDLSRGRLVVQSRPDEAHVQFSTYCNMSCVMCWNGDNPPVRDMSPEVLERLGEQFGDDMAVLIPHDGSEPTARMWSEACEFARRYGLRMHLTTNVQGLSERRLTEALDVVHSLDLSIDSHLPEVLERIRPGARTRSIFRNLPRILDVARDAGIDCEINVVFMTLNAGHLPETVDHLADLGARAVSVIRLVDINGSCAAIDPLRHLPRAQIERIHRDCVTVATQRSMRLRWLVDDPDRDSEGATIEHDEADRDEAWSDLERVAPGFCRFVHSGIRVSVDGDVTPCGYAGTKHLQLGNLVTAERDEVWNGPTAQDLRRAMYTRDLPRPCDTCQHAQTPPPDDGAPMLVILGDPDPSVTGDLEVDGPDHMYRDIKAPSMSVRGTGPFPDPVTLLVAHGRSSPRRWELRRGRVRRDGAEYPFPDELWESLRENQGYWWMPCVTGPTGADVPLGDVARCVVRHRDLPRIAGSRLRYPDDRADGHLWLQSRSARVDLGARPLAAQSPAAVRLRRVGRLLAAALARVLG